MDPPPVPEEPPAMDWSALSSFFARDMGGVFKELRLSRLQIAERFAGEGESSMDAAPPPMPEERPARDWSLLPLDVLCSVFVMVGAVDVLMGAGLVCRSWLQAAMVPHVWRTVDMENHDNRPDMPGYVAHEIAKAAVDRSDGQLRVFVGKWFVTHELIKYIVERSPCLTTLRLVSCYYDVFSKPLASAIRESPLMELRSLDLDFCRHSVEELTDFLENCPVLEVLRLHNCLAVSDEKEHALRSKFARIETMTIGWDRNFYYDSDIESYESDFDPRS